MNFTVYRSSAGSGKTFTLVKEYLKIALADENGSPLKFRKILAITFTNKAAQEMKDRVIRALKELSAPVASAPSPLAKILIEELKLDPFTLAERAENLLRAILHNYGDFAIGTIDAFTHRIVRSFAYDLGLPVNFEVETEKEELLQKAVDKLMSMIGNDSGITTTLMRFAEEKTEDEKGWQIERELKASAENLLKENGTRYAERLRELSLKDFSAIRNNLFQLTAGFEKKMKDKGEKAMQIINTSGAEEGDFANGNKGITNWFRKVTKGDYKSVIEPGANVLKTIENDSWASGAAKKNGNAEKVLAVAPALRDIYHEIRAFAEEHYPAYITRASVRRHLYSLAVLNELEKILRSFREEDSVIHISEFNRIISKVVTEQPVPYIFEKLGARYSHFLIDEFQDTSVLQWENLLPLLENGLAENNFSMVVGDAKQAIYRWRSGDVEQFVVLPNLLNKDNNPLMTDREQSLIRHYREEELDKNFRSRREVVEFNNRLFFALAAQLSSPHAQIYQRVEQKIKPGNDGGFVELRFPQREGNKEEVYVQYTSETIELVQQLLSEGWRKKDIALLVRENSNGSLLANELIARGIPVLSSDSLLIGNSPLVCCIVSLLRVLEHPEDRIALTDVADYMNKTCRGHFPLHDVRHKEAKLSDVLAAFGITEVLGFLSILPLYQQCESLVRVVFPQEQKNAWVVFFLDELLRFSGTRNPDRASFFAWWEDRSRNASVVIPEGTDAVNIMTIHKSKGLEFPVVIIPYLDWKEKFKSPLWVDLNDAEVPELTAAIVTESDELKRSSVAEQYAKENDKKVLDQMNVLYVGCTRAVDQLYVISQRTDKAEVNDPTNVVVWLNNLYREQLAESDVIRFGEKMQPSREEEKQKAEFVSLASGEGKWTGKIRVRKYSDEAWSEGLSARERGKMLHHLLRRIKSIDDVEQVISDAQNTGFIASGDRERITAMIRSVVNHEQLQSFFATASESVSEGDILIPGDRASRPDRVVINGNEATVLEYKTGMESEDHVHQVRHYKSLLERMGYTKVNGLLIYLEPLKLVRT